MFHVAQLLQDLFPSLNLPGFGNTIRIFPGPLSSQDGSFFDYLDYLSSIGNDELAFWLVAGLPDEPIITNPDADLGEVEGFIEIDTSDLGAELDISDPDPGLATFEPDPLVVEADTGTAEEIEVQEPMPIHARVLTGLGGLIFPALAGTAFGAGTFLGDALAGLLGTSDAGGTSTAPPEPSTTPGGATDVGGTAVDTFGNGRPPTIAQIRQMILKNIGAQHGRRSFSYNVARRILRDLGEEAGARCLGITAAQACFLLIHPPKRRGRQITPKQINRALGAYKRVKALNKSVRKTLGTGCKL